MSEQPKYKVGDVFVMDDAHRASVYNLENILTLDGELRYHLSNCYGIEYVVSEEYFQLHYKQLKPYKEEEETVVKLQHGFRFGSDGSLFYYRDGVPILNLSGDTIEAGELIFQDKITGGDTD